MNYWHRWIGSFQKKTGALTLSQVGAYDRLLDHYYGTEEALPGTLDECYRICKAMTADERRSVQTVLQKFFKLGQDGKYRQERAEEELAQAQPRIAAAKANGEKGGRPRKNPAGTHKKPSGIPSRNPEETQSETSTTSTKGDTPFISPQWLPPDWVPLKQWGDFVTMRKAMRSVPFTEAARDGVIRELAKLRDAGHSPEQLLDTAVMHSWRTVYPPKTAAKSAAPKYASAAAGIFDQPNSEVIDV